MNLLLEMADRVEEDDMGHIPLLATGRIVSCRGCYLHCLT